MSDSNQHGALVVGLGEALFDCLPEQTVLGGAPINVAVHAQQLLSRLGGRAYAATRIGRDDLGERLLQELRQRGVAVDWVQRDPALPTGRVDVAIDDAGNAAYRFPARSAWDAIEFNDSLKELAGRCQAVTYGTLAQRHPESRAAIQSFLREADQALRVFDLNFRQDFYNAAVVDESLAAASAVKLASDELREVGAMLGLPGDNPDQLAMNLAARYRLDWVALTQGAKGTVLYADGQKHLAPVETPPSEEGADTVGAGDSCCAALLSGWLLEWPPEKTLRLANQVGAYVATRRGATPKLPDDLLDEVAAG